MTQCKNCQTEVNESLITCTTCNYPIKGSDKEQASFIAKQVMQKGDVTHSIKQLEISRIILFALGAFYCVLSIVLYFIASFSFTLVINIILGLMFIGFGFLTYKKPVIALGIPLGLTLLYYLALLLLDFSGLVSGLFWKIIIIGGLGYGFFGVRKANKILKENPYLASTLGYGEVK